jgi:hypothetical protein
LTLFEHVVSNFSIHHPLETVDFGNPGRSNFYGLKPSEENFIAPGKRVSGSCL